MNNEINVIGEGTYGCVHKPSLHCKKNIKNFTYKNKVSKLLNNFNAKKELTEYSTIERVDKHNKFYTGKPLICNPKKTYKSENAIDQCENFKSSDIHKYSLLVMDDGGLNLYDYGKIVKKYKQTPENINKIEKFWIEAHRLLLGLRNFIRNDIIHHDLKPQNIVYNEDKNRVNFIDFGLMTKISKSIRDARNSIYNYDSWFSFPFEIEFIQQDDYMRFAKLSIQEKENEYKKMLNRIKKPDYFKKIFFDYISSDIDPSLKKITIKNFFEDYFYTMINDIVPGGYDEFVKKCFKTFDIYGTGMALLYMLHKSLHLLETPLRDDMNELFTYMVTACVSSRYEIDEILEKYEDILKRNNILKKHHLYFENHELKYGAFISHGLQSKIDNSLIYFGDSSQSEKIIENISNKTPIKKCPDGKELNPQTKRCVNVCKPGYSRNDKFKCVKNKTVKKQKNESNSKKSDKIWFTINSKSKSDTESDYYTARQ